jgi:amino acid adenylation domain-containing protein
MPVVFTSLVTADQERGGEDPFSWLGETVFAITQTPQVSLDLQAREVSGALVLNWDHRKALFPTGLVSDMADKLRQFLIVLASEQEVWGDWSGVASRFINAISAADVQTTSSPSLEGTLLHAPFLKEASRDGGKIAVVTPDAEFSYAELRDLSRRISGWLIRRDASQESPVAIVMHKGWEQVAAVLGVVQAGAAYLPIDAGMPAQRLQLMLKLGRVKLALTQPQYIEQLEWPDGLGLLGVSRAGPAAIQPAGNLPQLDSENLAYVIYTSGSTGVPKGVAVEHRAAWNTIAAVNRSFGIGPADRVLALSSLSFDLSVWDIFGVLAAGGTIVLPDAGSIRDPHAWLQLAERFEVTIWNSVPALFQLLVEEALDRGTGLPRSLRLSLLSGDWIAVDLPDRARALAESLEIISLGGATEAGIWSIAYPVNEVHPKWDSIPYGRALDNQSCSVLDADLAPCPVWVTGDLYIGGSGLARGYWHDEVRTRESFIRHPQTGERLYRTGDLGRWLPDGNIELLGRMDHQVKIRGFRIEPGEIEAALTRLASIQAAVVVATDQRHGIRTLMAHIVPAGDSAPAVQELRNRLATVLPDYMIPSRFHVWPALPLSANGKIDRALLIRVGGEQGGGPPLEPAPPAPVEMHDRLAAIISEQAGVSVPDEHTSLLTLGVDSISMIGLVNAVEDQFGFRPGLDDVYREPTLAGLTRLCQTPRYEVQPAARGGSTGEQLRDLREREQFTAANPGLRKLPDPIRKIGLTAPADAVSFAGRCLRRRSHRRFDDRPVSLADLGAVLAMLRPAGGVFPGKRLYASAGGLYPVQAYVYARPRRVESLSGGYYYNPVDHALVELTTDVTVPAEAFDRLVNRPIFNDSAFALFLIADMRAIQPMYGDRSLHYVTIEAGLITQVLEEAAPGFGLGLCQIGEFDVGPLAALFRLEDGHKPLHCILGGVAQYPDQEPELVLPLTPAQERVASTVIDGNCPPSWNVPVILRCQGVMDLAGLEEMLNIMLLRHDALRAVLIRRDGQAAQGILSRASIKVSSVDLSGQPPQDAEEAARELARNLVRQPFNLEHGPMLRVSAIRVPGNGTLLVLILNAFVSDCLSLRLLLGEMGPETCPPAPGPTTYPKVVNCWVNRDDVLNQRQLAYWNNHLQGARRLSGYFQGKTDPAGVHNGQSVFPVRFIPEVVAKIRELGNQENATLFMTLLACLVRAVHRLTDATDITVGTTVSCRTLKGAAGVVGPFANHLALRFDLRDGVSLRALINQARSVSVSAFAHQELPYETVQGALRPDGEGHVIELSFVLHQGHAEEMLHLPGVIMRPEKITVDDQPLVPVTFPVECVLVEEPEWIRGEIRCGDGWPRTLGPLLQESLLQVGDELIGKTGGKLREATPAEPAPTREAAPSLKDYLRNSPALPGSAFQQLILACWQEVLKREIDPDMTFAEAGGDSIAAMSLVARLEELLDVQVPIEMFFNNPTPLTLTARIEQRVSLPSDGPLTLLKKGHNPPILFIPGRIPSPYIFLPLIQSIDTGQAVYLANLLAARSLREPGPTVEKLAAELLDALFNAGYDGAQGTAGLVGHSAGGVVVYEMALQLLERRQPAPVVVLMDADTPHSAKDRGWQYTLSILRRILKSRKESGWKDMTTVLLDKCGRRFMSMVSKSKKEAEALIDGKEVPEALAGNREIMVLYRVIDHMTLSYHLKQSPLAVTLILSRNETRPESLQRGWRSSALGGCNLYEVPGDKMSKFRTPYLYDLSRLLSLVLLDVHRRA